MASVVALAVLLTVAVLATSTVLIARQQGTTQNALQAETRARDDLQEALERERRDANFHRITLAHRDLSADNLGQALKLLEECPEDLREWEWHYLMRLCRVEPLVLRDKDKTEVNGVAFSPDGERLASAGGDGAVKIWNSRTGKVIRQFPAHDKGACSVAFHPDGLHLASAGADGLVKVWDLATERVVFRGPCDALRKFGAAYTVAFRPPDGRQLAAGSEGAVIIWDWKKNRPQIPEQTLPGHKVHSIPVAFSRDGLLATGGAARQGQTLWDPETGRLLLTLPAHQHPVCALAFSPDGGQLATASLDRTVKLWDTATGELFRIFFHSGNVLGIAFSPDGARLASTGEDKTVHVWDPTTGREVLGLRGHTGSCGCVVFSPDGWRLAAASTDGTIRIWDATPLRGDEGQETTFAHHGDELRSVAVSPDGDRIVSAGHGGFVKVWDAATGQMINEYPGHTVLVFSVAWDPDGRRIASAGSDGPQVAVKVWDAQNGREHFIIQPGGEHFTVPFMAVAFSSGPEGRYLVTGKQSGAVEVWDAKTGHRVVTLGTHDREIRGLVFSRDGKHLASASGDGEVKLWDAKRLEEKQEARLTLRARVPGPSLNVAFSTDGRRLATGGDGDTVKIWDVQTGKELRTLPGHSGDVYTVAFSPDDEGRWIASGGEDSTVKIWDSRSGELVHSFRGHTGLVCSLAFSPDGKRLYSGSRDKTVKVWNLTQPISKAGDR